MIFVLCFLFVVSFGGKIRLCCILCCFLSENKRKEAKKELEDNLRDKEIDSLNKKVAFMEAKLAKESSKNEFIQGALVTVTLTEEESNHLKEILREPKMKN